MQLKELRVCPAHTVSQRVICCGQQLRRSKKVSRICLLQLVNTTFKLGPSSQAQRHKKYRSVYIYFLYLHSKLSRNVTFVLMEKSKI